MNPKRWCDQSLITRCVPRLQASCPHSRQGSWKRRIKNSGARYQESKFFRIPPGRVPLTFHWPKTVTWPSLEAREAGKANGSISSPSSGQEGKKILTSQTKESVATTFTGFPWFFPLNMSMNCIHVVWADHDYKFQSHLVLNLSNLSMRSHDLGIK